MPVDQNRQITQRTRRNLIEGVRSSPMADAAVNAIMAQAVAFTELLVETYSAEVAAGEVGQEGSGRATQEPTLGESPPRVLLYGRVQSGKTAAMILTSALCLDNGFRVIVVLTTDNVALVRQTASRFKTLDGPRVLVGVKEGPSYEWEGQEEQLREFVASDGLVLVCTKNYVNLPQVIHFLQQVDASNYPVLVLDDEADAATPDTTIAARSASRPNAPAFASTINRFVIENDRPQQEGFSLGEAFPHSLYVQVTATPYVLVLQRRDARIRPTTHYLLEPGEGYCGGNEFFGEFDPRPGANMQPNTIILVGDNEAALMRRQVPEGFARSIDFFILSACARARASPPWPSEGFKHLSHTSHRINDHNVVLGHVEAHLNRIRQLLRTNDAQTRAHFQEAYRELCRSLLEPPSLDYLVDAAARAIHQVDIVRVNSEADVPSYGPRLNFVIGGNILGRGLTIDDLLVTYYIREAKTSQMDTVWQHARMYGYRRSYLDYMRIYLPQRLALRFQQIHEAEETLRGMMAANADPVLIQLPSSSRATRPNALEAGVIGTLDAGRAQINPQLLTEDPTSAIEVLRILQENDVPIGEPDRERRTVRIPMEKALELIALIPISDDDHGIWQPDTITALMQRFAPQLTRGCIVYVRAVEGNDDRTRARLAGPEVRLIRSASPDAPALALMHLGEAETPSGWYPTLVMPPNNPGYVFSRS